MKIFRLIAVSTCKSGTYEPLGGYMNRQINFLLNNYKFQSGEDKENKGLLIPRYLATGRTAPNGKVYPEVTKKNEDELVPVRSIITKRDGDLNVMTPDLFSKGFLKTDINEGSAIGLSAGSSFSEATTQGILGLNKFEAYT